MSFITLGTTDQLQIKIPIKNTKGWANGLRDEFFQKVVEHDHSGDGKGVPISGQAIAGDTITGDKFRLLNDEYLRSRNNADSSDVNIIKVNTSDQLELGADLLSATIITLNSTTSTLTNATIAQATVGILTSNDTATIAISSTSTVKDLTTPALTGAVVIDYVAIRNTEKAIGTLTIDATNNIVVDEFIGDDLGSIFTMAAGVLSATNSSGSDALTINLIEVRL